MKDNSIQTYDRHKIYYKKIYVMVCSIFSTCILNGFTIKVSGKPLNIDVYSLKVGSSFWPNLPQKLRSLLNTYLNTVPSGRRLDIPAKASSVASRRLRPERRSFFLHQHHATTLSVDQYLYPVSGHTHTHTHTHSQNTDRHNVVVQVQTLALYTVVLVVVVAEVIAV